jgi:hypothetical protein
MSGRDLPALGGDARKGRDAGLTACVDQARSVHPVSVWQQTSRRDYARGEKPGPDESLDDAPHLSLGETGLERKAGLRRPAFIMRGDVDDHRVEHEAFGGAQRPERIVIEAIAFGRPVSF